MVGCVDHRRVVVQPGVAQCREDAADVVIGPAAQTVVGGKGRQPFFSAAELLFVAREVGVGLDPGVSHVTGARVQLGQRQTVERVQVEAALRRQRREVRRHQAHVEHEVFAAALPGLLQPFDAASRDGVIVLGVRRLARADGLAQHALAARLADAGVADRCPHHAHAAGHVHGQVLGVEAGRVFLGPVVQLADALDPDALLLQRMAPATGLAAVGRCVVPMPGAVHAMTDGKGGARRHADRARRVGAGEARSPRRQRVEVRRLHDGAARTAHVSRVMIVGHQDQDIAAGHGRLLLRPCGADGGVRAGRPARSNL
jgi:hypothetical protein